MTVYVIADIKVTDDGWVPAYAAAVHEIVHKHGGPQRERKDAGRQAARYHAYCACAVSICGFVQDFGH